MKANQAYKNDEEAVSPVIGVILMVAITVVLAAVVFVLVTKLSSNQSTSQPQVPFDKSDSTEGGTLTVVRVDNAPAGGLLWLNSDATPGVTIGGASNSAAACTIVVAKTGAAPAAGDIVAAGDTITCTKNGAITVSYTPTTGPSALLYNSQFP